MRAGASFRIATMMAALSGASLDRPALQKLLADVRAGKINIVVVYKVDRLTRSLADFAKLVELFDQHGVSFVSITQSFNTTSSMGRLTLNVLLSFAQFEREVIGERVRDKIAASKRKGIWVGGPVPLGYRCHRQEARDRARGGGGGPHHLHPLSGAWLHRGFDRRSSIGAASGPRPMAVAMAAGAAASASASGSLAHLLKNRFYIGEVAYRGEVHRGEHEPILDRDLFEAVQARLAANAVARQVRLRGSAGHSDRPPLRRPRQPHEPDACEQARRALPVLCVACALAAIARPKPAASRACRPPRSRPSCATASAGTLQQWVKRSPTAIADRELIERHVARVIVKPQALEVCLVPAMRHRPSD